MIRTIRHGRQQESMEAKTRWFRSLSMADRMEVFCSFTDLALSINPHLKDRTHAQPIAGRVQVLSKEDLIASKQASGREVDLEDGHMLQLPDHEETTSCALTASVSAMTPSMSNIKPYNLIHSPY